MRIGIVGLLFIASKGAVAATVLPPITLYYEHCTVLDERAHCVLEQLNNLPDSPDSSDHLRLVMTPDAYEVWSQMPWHSPGVVIDVELMAPDAYARRRTNIWNNTLGGYIYDFAGGARPGERLAITIWGEPAHGLNDASYTIAPAAEGGMSIQRDGQNVNLADSRLANSACTYGVLGGALEGAAEGALSGAGTGGAIGGPKGAVAGAVLGGAVGTVWGALKGAAEHCKDETTGGPGNTTDGPDDTTDGPDGPAPPPPEDDSTTPNPNGMGADTDAAGEALEFMESDRLDIRSIPNGLIDILIPKGHFSVTSVLDIDPESPDVWWDPGVAHRGPPLGPDDIRASSPSDPDAPWVDPMGPRGEFP